MRFARFSGCLLSRPPLCLENGVREAESLTNAPTICSRHLPRTLEAIAIYFPNRRSHEKPMRFPAAQREGTMSTMKYITVRLLSAAVGTAIALPLAFGQNVSWADYGGGSDSSHFIKSRQI